MWPIVLVRFMPKTKLNRCDRSGSMQSMMKTTQDNDVINRMGKVYTENDT